MSPRVDHKAEALNWAREAGRYQAMWEEAARAAIEWRRRFELLSDAVDEYFESRREP